ncbi:hypothetical protein DPMN_102380 [Dreissena polymorpha]|uniref:Uncharacterized protein n=1 Tax=Dreissena polymorpha TaxID=45954 RepID=A0A9D4LKZ8_DREPO|nr:hypothetical protein DPMN_102380 [Dreissena polymorpha]
MQWYLCALWLGQCSSMWGLVRGSWHLGHAGSIPRTYFPAPPGNRVVPELRRVMALSSTMLAEYLSGGLRFFAGLVKVFRREDKFSVVGPEIPLTHFKFLCQGVDLSRCQGFYGPPQEALLCPPVGLLIPADVDMCWTPY